jgi:pseudouridine-5'-phosphate glycosidase
LLERLRVLSEGASVRANLALLTNNARVAAQLARALVQAG